MIRKVTLGICLMALMVTVSTAFGRSAARSFHQTLEFGETKTILHNGPISVEAICEQNVEGNNVGDFGDRIRLLAKTDIPGTASTSVEPFIGPGSPVADREFTSLNNVHIGVGEPLYTDRHDGHSILAPSGHALLLDAETTGLGLNIFGADCSITGVFHKFRARLESD